MNVSKYIYGYLLFLILFYTSILLYPWPIYDQIPGTFLEKRYYAITRIVGFVMYSVDNTIDSIQLFWTLFKD